MFSYLIFQYLKKGYLKDDMFGKVVMYVLFLLQDFGRYIMDVIMNVLVDVDWFWIYILMDVYFVD